MLVGIIFKFSTSKSIKCDLEYSWIVGMSSRIARADIIYILKDIGASVIPIIFQVPITQILKFSVNSPNNLEFSISV